MVVQCVREKVKMVTQQVGEGEDGERNTVAMEVQRKRANVPKRTYGLETCDRSGEKQAGPNLVKPPEGIPESYKVVN